MRPSTDPLAPAGRPGHTRDMDPERLARTTVSVSFAAMAGAILGAVVGFLLFAGLWYWRPAALAVPILCVAGAIGGLRLGWRWAATMPIEPKADDQEADYSGTPPARPVTLCSNCWWRERV